MRFFLIPGIDSPLYSLEYVAQFPTEIANFKGLE